MLLTQQRVSASRSTRRTLSFLRKLLIYRHICLSPSFLLISPWMFGPTRVSFFMFCNKPQLPLATCAHRAVQTERRCDIFSRATDVLVPPLQHSEQCLRTFIHMHGPITTSPLGEHTAPQSVADNTAVLLMEIAHT